MTTSATHAPLPHLSASHVDQIEIFDLQSKRLDLQRDYSHVKQDVEDFTAQKIQELVQSDDFREWLMSSKVGSTQTSAWDWVFQGNQPVDLNVQMLRDRIIITRNGATRSPLILQFDSTRQSIRTFCNNSLNEIEAMLANPAPRPLPSFYHSHAPLYPQPQASLGPSPQHPSVIPRSLLREHHDPSSYYPERIINEVVFTPSQHGRTPHSRSLENQPEIVQPINMVTASLFRPQTSNIPYGNKKNVISSYQNQSSRHRQRPIYHSDSDNDAGNSSVLQPGQSLSAVASESGASNQHRSH